MNITNEHVRALHYPSGVAVVGATERTGALGNMILANLLKTPERKFDLYPVNLTRSQIMGLPAYPNVSSISKGNAELVVIVTPAHTCADVLLDCGRSGKVKVAIVIAAGFKEVGVEGLALEQSLIRIAEEYNIAIIGPNCLGVQAPYHHMNASFSLDSAGSGPIAFFSQSGAICCAILDWSIQYRIGFSSFISVGSMSHIQWHHLIDFATVDSNTKYVMIYMETIGDSVAFLESAKRLRAAGKRIFVIKAGRTDAAAAAAASHTGSLAGNYDGFLAAMRRAGVSVVESLNDFQNLIMILSNQPLPVSRKVYILTNAGGPGVLATDECEINGLQVIGLNETLKSKLNDTLPPAWSKSNPIDILGDAKPDDYGRSLKLILQHGDPDANIIILLTPQSVTCPDITAEKVAETLKDRSGLAGVVMAVWQGGANTQKGYNILLANGIPTCYFPDNAARTLSILAKAADTPNETALEYVRDDVRYSQALKIIDGARMSGSKNLREETAKRLIALYGIPVALPTIVQDENSAIGYAEEIGFPVVAKLNSSTILHKSDVGGVILNIKNSAQLREAVRQVKGCAPEADVEGVAIQKMYNIDSGYELLLGSYTDPQFGPIMMFGSGGTLVEVYRDTATCMPLVTDEHAMQLIKSTKISKSLLSEGTMRFKAANLSVLRNVISKFSILIHELRDTISECEINPLFVNSEGCVVLDARIILSS